MSAATESSPPYSLIGPRRVGNALFFYKGIVGLVGGLSGTVILLLVVMLGSWLFPTVFSDIGTDTFVGNPLLTFIILVMVFLTSIMGNLVALSLMSLVDRSKYVSITTYVTQVFMFNLLIFIFSIPIYFILQNAGVATITYVVGIHLVLTAFISSIVAEILSSREYVLVTLYGDTFAMLIALAFSLLVFALLGSLIAKALFVFLVFPLIWTLLGFCQSAAEMLYRWAYDVYGVDFLNTSAIYNAQIPEEEEEKAKDGETEAQKIE